METECPAQSGFFLGFLLHPVIPRDSDRSLCGREKMVSEYQPDCISQLLGTMTECLRLLVWGEEMFILAQDFCLCVLGPDALSLW